ncbi:MAG TPA: YbaN family protein, partial [Bacteroidales bacterium]|nr:YbaN family protein [Bacteroidales bacterium]
LLGIAGLFLPLLPTTPFFLLTAGCYIKSSPKLYDKFSKHPLTNRVLSGDSATISTKSRNIAIIIMWSMITLTSFSLSEKPLLVVLLIVTGITGTYFKLKFFKKNPKEKS